MDENETKRLSLKLMQTTWAVYFTTLDRNGFPHTRAMDNLRSKERYPKLTDLFASSEDNFWVLLGTNTSSPKIEHILENPHVSIYYCEPRKFHGLMLAGKAEIVIDPLLKRKIWHDYWTRYYPKGVDDSDYSVLSVHPTQAEGWWEGNKFRFTLKESKSEST